jgi:hypothetical protein
MALIAFGNAVWATKRGRHGRRGAALRAQNVTGMAVSVVGIVVGLVEKFYWRPRELREQASAAVLSVLDRHNASSKKDTNSSFAETSKLDVATAQAEDGGGRGQRSV